MPITRSLWLAPVLLGILALAIRLLHLDQPALFDELYHVLAARNWLAEGELRIGDGVYERTPLFTILIAGWFALFGESLEVARLPSVLAGAALVVLLFLWVRAVAGALAAWIAGLLLCLSPEAIGVSQYVRFYALHGLLFWLGAIGTYRLVTAPPGWAGGTLVGAGVAVCFYSGWYLQTVTLIGLVGVAAWAVPALAVPWLSRGPARRGKWLGAAVVALLALAAVWPALQIEAVAALLDRYREVPLWLAERRDLFYYYHDQFGRDYPTLWPLAGIALVLGLSYRPQPTIFCAVVFAVAILAHSFAGAKKLRYVYYTLPFLFALWGIALAAVWPHLRHFLEQSAARALGYLQLGRLGRPAVVAVLSAAVVFTVFANTAFLKTALFVAGVTLPPLARPPDWAAAREPLSPWLDDAAIVLTTSELEALYYLGRHDVLVSKSRLSEMEGVDEFGIDPRTGRPVISTPESLRLVMACYPKGLIVTSDSRWRDPAQLDDAVADLVLAEAEPVELPARGIHAYVWDHPPDAPRPADCPDLDAGT